MEIRQLRHFLAVMDTKSYWRAAESCGITPQSLSKSLRRIADVAVLHDVRAERALSAGQLWKISRGARPLGR